MIVNWQKTFVVGNPSYDLYGITTKAVSTPTGSVTTATPAEGVFPP
jgi:hypothetical protein